MEYRYSLLISLIILASSVQAAKLPSVFERCKVSAQLDGKNNECLKKAINDGIHHLTIDGSKELGAIDLDPMTINRIYIERGQNRPIAIKLEYTNNVLTGLSGLTVHKVKGRLSSPKNFELILEGVAEEMTMVGPYKINGKVLVLPIQGVGHSNMTMKNMKSIITIKGSPMTKNGKEYLNVDSFHISMSPSRMYMFFGNLFNGDKDLGDNMNKFLNDNWQDIYGELREAIEDAFSAVYKEYTKRIFNKVPFNGIFIQE